MTMKYNIPSEASFCAVYSNNTLEKTAEHFGVSLNTIKRWRKLYGYEKKKIFQPNAEEFAAYYQSHSMTETACHFGVSVATVANWVKMLGLHKRTPVEMKPQPTKGELHAFLCSHTNQEAAAHYGLSVASISRLIRRLGLTDVARCNLKVPPNKLPIPPREEFDRIYSSMPIAAVAAHFGVGTHIIHKWRNQLSVTAKRDHALPEAFTQQQQELLIGSMLGDGCIRRVVRPGELVYFTEQHGPDQAGYLQYKFDLLKPFSNTLYEKHNRRVVYLGSRRYAIDPSQRRTSFMFETYVSPLFSLMEQGWYRRDHNGNYEYTQHGNTRRRIKRLPDDLVLTPFAAAIWYFDDGSSRWHRSKARSISIATQSFTAEECDRLRGLLNGLGIAHCSLTRNGCINILARSFVDFLDMVSPHLPHPCLAYKVEYSPTR